MKKYSVAETEKKVKKIFTIVCDTLELIVAVIVAIGVILAMLSLIPELGGLLKSDTGALTPFLEQVFPVHRLHRGHRRGVSEDALPAQFG